MDDADSGNRLSTDAIDLGNNNKGISPPSSHGNHKHHKPQPRRKLRVPALENSDVQTQVVAAATVLGHLQRGKNHVSVQPQISEAETRLAGQSDRQVSPLLASPAEKSCGVSRNGISNERLSTKIDNASNVAIVILPLPVQHPTFIIRTGDATCDRCGTSTYEKAIDEVYECTKCKVLTCRSCVEDKINQTENLFGDWKAEHEESLVNVFHDRSENVGNKGPWELFVPSGQTYCLIADENDSDQDFETVTLKRKRIDSPVLGSAKLPISIDSPEDVDEIEPPRLRARLELSPCLLPEDVVEITSPDSTVDKTSAPRPDKDNTSSSSPASNNQSNSQEQSPSRLVLLKEPTVLDPAERIVTLSPSPEPIIGNNEPEVPATNDTTLDQVDHETANEPRIVPAFELSPFSREVRRYRQQFQPIRPVLPGSLLRLSRQLQHQPQRPLRQVDQQVLPRQVQYVRVPTQQVVRLNRNHLPVYDDASYRRSVSRQPNIVQHVNRQPNVLQQIKRRPNIPQQLFRDPNNPQFLYAHTGTAQAFHAIQTHPQQCVPQVHPHQRLTRAQTEQHVLQPQPQPQPQPQQRPTNIHPQQHLTQAHPDQLVQLQHLQRARQIQHAQLQQLRQAQQRQSTRPVHQAQPPRQTQQVQRTQPLQPAQPTNHPQQLQPTQQPQLLQNLPVPTGLPPFPRATVHSGTSRWEALLFVADWARRVEFGEED